MSEGKTMTLAEAVRDVIAQGEEAERRRQECRERDAHEFAVMTGALVWGNTPPDGGGWFWCRVDAGTRQERVEVVNVHRWSDSSPWQFRFGQYDYHLDNCARMQFAGPLDLPLEPLKPQTPR